MHAYEQYGESFVEKLNGMFGIAIWDSVRKKLILARDRTGEKPLYYRQAGQDFYFASEMKAFLRVPGLHIALREDVLPAYLSFGNVDGKDTLIKDTYEVLPGHMVVPMRRDSQYANTGTSITAPIRLVPKSPSRRVSRNSLKNRSRCV